MLDPYAEVQSTILRNGLTVHAIHRPRHPWEAVGFIVHSGAECDPIGLEGLSHFVEHLVSKNTNMSKEKMHALFEDCGGTINLGATAYSYTCYNFFVPTNKTILAKAFSLFGHMLLSATLKKSIERERQIIIGEFHRHYPIRPKYNLDMRERKMLYSGYWLERSVRPLGNPESVAQITQKNLQSYYDEHYTPANISIIGVGGMRLSELTKLLSESPFATDKNGFRTPLPTPIINITPPLETRYVFESSKYMSTPIEVGAYRSVAKIPGSTNRYAISIMQRMLNEVLNEKVREQNGWAYAINASRCDFRYFHEFSIDCKGLMLKAIDKIDDVIKTCIASMADRKYLFKQTKRQALAHIFMADLADKDICDEALRDLGKYQKIISLKEISDNVECLTMINIKDVIRWLQPKQRWTLIVRP